MPSIDIVDDRSRQRVRSVTLCACVVGERERGRVSWASLCIYIEKGSCCKSVLSHFSQELDKSGTIKAPFQLTMQQNTL